MDIEQTNHLDMDKNFKKPALLLFDVYETLLSMDLVEKRVNHLLDSKRGYIIWFNLLMQHCFIESLTGVYHSFNEMAKVSLELSHQLLGQNRGRDDEFQQIIELMKHLPVQENVQEGLSMIYDRGYRVAALTNSPAAIVRNRMELTGLISYFEKVLSAEQLMKCKPAPEVYQWAAGMLGVDSSEVMVVSSHGWDIAGAKSSGMMTAKIGRSGLVRYPLSAVADIECSDMVVLAQVLEQTWP